MTFLSSAPSQDMTLSLLACPRCHADIHVDNSRAACASCGSKIEIRDGVVVARESETASYFDDVFEVMQAGNHAPGTWDIFYQRQAEAVEQSLRAGEVVIDVGCGPELPYDKKGAFIVGVDASFASIRANKMVDLRVFGSAAELPLKSASADAVVCFYSIHHMTGKTVSENESIVEQAFREFARVLKPTGRLMIFDMSPWWPFSQIEDLCWTTARRKLGSSLDMFFWKDRRLEQVGSEAFPGGSFQVQRFAAPAFQTFPPIFSKPGLRLPRMFYPFDINLYTWRHPGAARA